MFHTEYSVGGVHRHLILGCIPDQPFGVSEGNIAGCGPVSLVIGNDLNFAMLKHSYTGVSSAQINADCWSLRHGS